MKDVVDFHCDFRLHREALKQSATDPLSGKIDVGILTTGLSSAARKRRVEVAQALKKLILSKEKVATVNYQKTFTEFKETSQLVSIFQCMKVDNKLFKMGHELHLLAAMECFEY